MFEIQHQHPEAYRQQTRRSTMVIALLFVALALLLSSAAVMLFGTPAGDNFRWNLGGVIAALALTITLVRSLFWPRPFMASAVYGWRLKRSLMRITNIMHHVNAGVAARDTNAMQLLRFYHLALTQMHQLDGNSSALSEAVAEINQHKERMEELEMNTEQPQLHAEWIETVKKIAPLPN